MLLKFNFTAKLASILLKIWSVIKIKQESLTQKYKQQDYLLSEAYHLEVEIGLNGQTPLKLA